MLHFEVFLLVLYLFETGSRYVACLPASTFHMLRLISAALLSALSRLSSHMHSVVLRQSLLRYRWLGSHSSFLCRSLHYFVFQIVVVQNLICFFQLLGSKIYLQAVRFSSHRVFFVFVS